MLTQYGEEARPLAGGQSLVPLLNLRVARPSALIDLRHCADLAFIERRGDMLAIGAMTRQIDAQNAPLVRELCPLVAEALAHAGPPAVRHRATVGGTLAHADRSAELPAVVAALDAILVIEGPTGVKQIPASEFFVGDLATAIRPGELLREVRFPIAPRGAVAVFVEAGNRQRDLAVAGLAAQLHFDGGCCVARLAVIGVEATPVRLTGCEALLASAALSDGMIDEVAALASQSVDPISDVNATAVYRRAVVGRLLGKVLRAAQTA